MEGMKQTAPTKTLEQTEGPMMLRLGDKEGYIQVQNAFMLCLYELRHGVSVDLVHFRANSTQVIHDAPLEWLGMNNEENSDVVPPSVAFSNHVKEHAAEVVDVHDMKQLEEKLKEMGIDTRPPTLH